MTKRGRVGRHRRVRRASIAGGVLLIIAGAATVAGVTLSGGPAAAGTQPPPSSCPTATSGSSSTDAAAAAAARAKGTTSPAILSARSATAAGTSATVTPLPGDARGIDVSSNNDEPDWASVKKSGVSFTAIKATEGDYYVNTATTTPYQQPGYAQEVTDATNAGLYVMPYAFGNPHTGNGTATCQADYAWEEISSVTSPAYGSSALMLPVALDIEQDPYASSTVNSCYNLSPSAMVTWIGQFLTEIKKDSGKTPVIYTNQSFWATCAGNSTAFDSYPLWLAGYGIASPPAMAGWTQPTFWQYTDAATVSGVSGPVDGDYLTPLTQRGVKGTAVTPVKVSTLAELANPGQVPAFSATGLPPGLSIDSKTGVISGTPISAGSFTVTATAALSGGASSSVSFNWDVTATIVIPVPDPVSRAIPLKTGAGAPRVWWKLGSPRVFSPGSRPVSYAPRS